MKVFGFLSALFFVATVHAQVSKAGDGYIEEVMEVNSNTKPVVSITNLKEVSRRTTDQDNRTDTFVRLSATSGTRWNSNARLNNVKNVEVLFKNKISDDNAMMVVYEVDGNNMGIVKTVLRAKCQESKSQIRCDGELLNKHKVYLIIAQ